jgi:hypothetical protein
MFFVTSSINFGSTSKSGKPCDIFNAPSSFANEDITVKIDVPIFGNFDDKLLLKFGMRAQI